MPVSCEPADLAEGAKCIDQCVPPGMQTAIQTYLLAIIAGVDPDPATLVSAAKCFACIPPMKQIEIQNYLLCQILNA